MIIDWKGLITADKVIASLISYHLVAGEWGLLIVVGKVVCIRYLMGDRAFQELVVNVTPVRDS